MRIFLEYQTISTLTKKSQRMNILLIELILRKPSVAIILQFERENLIIIRKRLRLMKTRILIYNRKSLMEISSQNQVLALILCIKWSLKFILGIDG
jgi:hypothetical protein